MTIPTTMLQTEIIDGEECWKIPMPTGLRPNIKYRVTLSANGRRVPLEELIASGDIKLVL
jgi:hypothetical protein